MSETVKAYCAECGPNKSTDVLYEHVNNWSIDEAMISGCIIKRAIQCRGCENISFQVIESDSETVDYYHDPHTAEVEQFYPESVTYYPPIEVYQRPSWFKEINRIDDDLGDLYEELYAALDSDLRVLSAIGVRTAFDRTTEILGVEPGKPFHEKLIALEKEGHITQRSKDLLTDLVEAGSAAAHRGWRPKQSQISVLLEILNALVHQSFILPRRHQKSIGTIPKRTK